MRRLSHFLISFALTAISLITFINASQPIYADGPNLTNVPDILGGRRTLFPVDDIVVTLNQFNTPVSNYIIDTLNGGPDTIPSYSAPGSANDTFATSVGRMYNMPQDVIATANTGQLTIAYQTPNTIEVQEYPINSSISPFAEPVSTMGDFAGTGYQGFAYSQANLFGSGGPQIALTVAVPVDVNNVNSEIVYNTLELENVNAIIGLTPVDFIGAGYEQLAAFTIGPNDVIDILVFQVNVATNQQGQATGVSINQIGSTTYTLPAPLQELQVTGGNFAGILSQATGLLQEQVLMHYVWETQDQSGCLEEIAPLTATVQTTSPLTLNLTVQPAYDMGNGCGETYTSLVSGYITFFSTTEQAIIGWEEGGLTGLAGQFLLFTLDSGYNVQLNVIYQWENVTGLLDLGLGNFDMAAGQDASLYLQIASMTNGGGSPQVNFFSIDPPADYATSQYASTPVDAQYNNSNELSSWSLRTGDVQGRSLLLGEPTVMTVQHNQPHIVMQMPPQHVDWVAPIDSPAQVFNVSAAPHGFNSSYQTVQTGTNQSSTKGTTSFSNSASIVASGGYRWGNPETGSVSVKVTTSFGAMHNSVVSSTYDTYSEQQFDASSTTGFDDLVWYNSEQHNIYIYPVIGQMVCPEATAPCPPSALAQLNVMFSVPTNVQQFVNGGSALEWWQPIHEPGNVFSYPWNLTQLQANNPNMDLLTSSTPTNFFTDGSTRTQLEQWAGQTGNTSTAGSASEINWGASVSISTKPGLEGGETGSVMLSYNGSKAFSTLYSSTNTLGASTGIGVNKPGTFPNPGEYQYAIEPYIFGQNVVPGTLQDITLGTDVTSNGILQAGFAADPTLLSAGAWWNPTYTAPDIAFNHPARWNVQSLAISDTIPNNCIRIAPTATTMDCVTFNPPQPDIWESEFHWMKGMLITPADANGEGPQLTQATAGDQLQLQARVYNYSLADMPADSGIVVQFYGQPWDSKGLGPMGNAFLIDQVALQPLPGFNSDTFGNNAPNWTTASTTALDTSAYADQYLVFWVTAYIRNQDGTLGAEMPDHGWIRIPPTLTSVGNATQYLQLYSNNIGVYKATFYIAPTATTSLARSTDGTLSTDNLTVSPRRALLGEKVEVKAMLRAQGAPIPGASAVFYDRVEGGKRKGFEYEGASHIRANDKHQVRVLFRPDMCGTHTLSVVTQPTGTTAEATLEVTINARAAVRQLIKQVKALGLKGRSGGGMMELLKEANKAFKNNDNKTGLDALEKFQARVKAQKGKTIPAEQADLMLAILAQIFECVKP